MSMLNKPNSLILLGLIVLLTIRELRLGIPEILREIRATFDKLNLSKSRWEKLAVLSACCAVCIVAATSAIIYKQVT